MIAAKVLFLAGLAAQSALASPLKKTRSEYAVKDSFNVPATWTELGPAPKDHVIELRIGVKQGDFDELERHLYEVSDPSHKRYGQHLSESDIHELITPASDSLELVHEWLEDNAVEPAHLTYTAAKDWIIASLPVEKVERLLDTQFSKYQHEDGTTLVRCPEWSLPAHLHEHIDTIQPTNSFMRTAPKSRGLKPVRSSKGDVAKFAPEYVSNATVAEVCNPYGITPFCLRTLYGTIDYVPQAAGKNKVGLTDYLGESNNRSDIHIFLEQYRPEAAKAAYEFKFDVIANGTDYQVLNETLLQDGIDEEGNLDAETILGISWPTPLIAYTTGGSPPFKPDDATPTDENEPYLVWLAYVLNTSSSDLAQTISTSYDDDEQTVPPTYARRVCNEFAQLGARGVSLFFAAGDDGVGATGYCYSNNGTNAPTFLPEFPSTCPYVTSVGATTNVTPEVAAYDPDAGFYSGGGFSNLFARPAYQDSVVSAYVEGLDGEFAPYFNASGRGYPDIAAQGQRFITIWDGEEIILDGTSASTPAAAAIISLVNDALIAAGKPPLGFLNPWLYGGGYKAFTDITSGSAIGCEGLGSGLGFPAKVGWDAVSGYGTPNFPKILAALGLNGTFVKNAGGYAAREIS